LNLAYGYNGLSFDDGGKPWAYGAHPPAQGAMFLNQPMNAFMYFNNNNTVIGDPRTAPEYYNFLQAKWKGGRPLTMWGTGYDVDSEIFTKYAFDGDPTAGTGWTEVTPKGQGSTPNTPGDRKGVMSAGPFTLQAKGGMCLDIALPFAQDLTGDNLTSVTLLKQRTKAIQQFYNNQPFANKCFNLVGINENPIHNKLFIYPNPSNGQFTISSEKAIESVELYDVMGKKVFSDTPKTETTQINTQLPKGMYLYRIMLQGNMMQAGKILVQ